MGDLGVDVIRYYIIHDRAGARAFNKQAIIPQSLDHNVEILKAAFCRGATEPLASG